MADWSIDNLWGLDSPWGDDDLTGQSEEAIDRLLAQFADPLESGNLQDQIAAHSDRSTLLLEILGQVLVAYRLGTGVGEQLDAIGERLDLDRLSLLDALYRIVLAIKAKSVISTQSTAPQILEICRSLIPAGRSIVIVDAPPANFLLTIEDISTLEFDILLPFIQDAKAGGVGVHFGFTPVDALIVDSAQAPKARDFVAASNDRAIWANPGFSPASNVACSFAAWVDAHSGGDASARVISIGDAGDVNEAVMMYINTNGQILIRFRRATTNLEWFSAAGAVPLDVGFKSLVATYDGLENSTTSFVVRLGGAVVPRNSGSNGSGAAVVGAGSYMLGALVTTPTLTNFDGQIAGVGVFSAVLTGDQTLLYEAGVKVSEVEGTVLKFDPELRGLVDSISGNIGTATSPEYSDPPPLLQSLPHIDPDTKIASTQGSGAYIEGKVSSVTVL